MKRHISKASRAITTAILACSAIGFAGTALANQCIWNKGGFELQVSWYRPSDLTLTMHAGTASVTAKAKPLLTHVFWPLKGVCTQSDETLTAVVSVSNAAFGLHNVGKVWVTDALLNIHGRSGVENSNLVTAKAQASHGDELGVVNGRPYLVTTPSTTRYLDVWGTVFDAAHGLGGPVP